MKWPWKLSFRILLTLTLYLAGRLLGTFFVGICTILEQRSYLTPEKSLKKREVATESIDS